MENNTLLDRITTYSLLVFAFSIPWSSALYRMSVLSLCICFAFYIGLGISGRMNKTAGPYLLRLQPSTEMLWPLALTAWVGLTWFWTSGSAELYRFDTWRYVKLTMIPVIGFFLNRLFYQKEIEVIRAFCYGIIILMLPTYLDYFGVFKLLGLSDYVKGDAAYSRESALGLNLVYWHNQIVHGFHVAMLFGISILTRPQKGPLKYIHILIAGLCAFDILHLIIGKMALFSLVASAFAVIFLNSEIKNKLRYATVIAVVLALLWSFNIGIQHRVLVLWTEMSSFFLNHQIDTSIGNRLHYWQISIDLFLQHPIIGSGAGSFRHWLITSSDPLSQIFHYHTHNEYLTQLSQFGVIGFILFTGIFFFSIKSVQLNPNPVVRSCVKLVFLVFLINALSDSSLHNEWEGWTLVLFASIAISNQIRFKPAS